MFDEEIFGCLVRILTPIITLIIILYVIAFAFQLALEAINTVLDFLNTLWNQLSQFFQGIIDFLRSLIGGIEPLPIIPPPVQTESPSPVDEPTTELPIGGNLVVEGRSIIKIAEDPKILRCRRSPGTEDKDESDIISRIADGTQVTVLCGSVSRDNHTWWQVEQPNQTPCWVSQEWLFPLETDTPPVFAQDGYDAHEQCMMTLLNDYRQQNNCEPVVHDTILQSTAEDWAKTAPINNQHSSYPHEIMADTTDTNGTQGAMRALYCPQNEWCWSRSTGGHRDMINTCSFNLVGIGHASTGSRKGNGWRSDWAWVVQFGTPSTSETPPAETDYNSPFLTDEQLEDHGSMTIDQIRQFLSSQGSYYQQPVEDSDGITFDPPIVIAQAANQYRINPKVILATLQKESSAVTSGRPGSKRALMGCATDRDVNLPEPVDTARGQLWCAAERFRTYHDELTNNGTTRSGWRVGVGKATVDGVTVIPATKAIAGQFTYTPYAGIAWEGQPLPDKCPPEGKCGGVYLFYDAWKSFGF